MKKILLVFIVLICAVILGVVFLQQKKTNLQTISQSINSTQTPDKPLDSLTIQAMREKNYPGSDIIIEQNLGQGENYNQYIASYVSDGLKIYGLLTVPVGQKPKDGFPVIVFNHGYISPTQYQTFPSVGQYASYYPEFSKNGYIVFKPDYRGNGNSEGQPEGAYYSPAYATDDLNAIASIKKYEDANPNRVGVWGHSMGGNITMRDLVVDPKDIKAAVIWGGVVGNYQDLFHWRDPSYHPSVHELSLRNRYRADLVATYGTPDTNPDFWHSVDPTYFVSDISAPVQLHAGESDEEVPPSFSRHFSDALKSAGKTAELYTYPGSDHNISQGFNLAMQRSLAFFDKYLK